MDTYNTQYPAPRSRRQKKNSRRTKRSFYLICILTAAVISLLCLPAIIAADHSALSPAGRKEVSPAGSSFSENSSVLFPGNDPAALPDDGTYTAGGPADGEDAASRTDGADDSWQLILVNRKNPLPEGYQDSLELTELSNGQSVDSRIYPALQSMFDRMREDGVYPVVASGFRTTEKQQSLMDEKIASFLQEGYSEEAARREAETWVAVPGTSEHQLGSAVDINADGIHSAGYQVYEWLDKHAHEYGFIHRYPSDKTDITGISNEPWHYRYVGIEAAGEIHRRGICLEEYLGQAD